MYMHQKCKIGNDINFDLLTMMRVINKVFPLVSLEPNILEIPGGVQLRVFRYTVQNWTRRYFFWVTAKVGVTLSLPSKGNATAWEQDCVLTCLLSRGREQQMEADMCLEPDPKRHIGAGALANAPNESATAPVTYYGVAGYDWWESGDARRFFAPSTTIYASDCNVKEIVVECIQLLESVNCSAGK
jgi:hypothetical protein